MKHLYTLVLAAAAMFAPIAGQAETLTVFPDATDKSNQLPVNGYFLSSAVHSQMIYPAGELTALKGKVIEKISFTMVQFGTAWKNISFTVKMGTTIQSQYDAANYITDGLSEVTEYSCPALPSDEFPSASAESPYTLEIALDKPFVYTGDNLVIDITNTPGTANGRTWNFKGKTQTDNTGITQTGSSSVVKFLPTVAFDYSDAATTSAALSTESISFPLTFLGEKVESKFKLTNTGTEILNGTITVNGEGFSVEPYDVVGLAADGALEFTVTLDAENAGDPTGSLVFNINGIDEPMTVDLKGWVVDAPDAVRDFFSDTYYSEMVPAGWNAYAEEYETATNAFSDGTTEYDSFGETLRFESTQIDGYGAILWNHANPMPYSDLYTRYYYLISPMVGGKFVFGATLYDSETVGAGVKAFEATYDEETHRFNIGNEIELSWDKTVAQGSWAAATGTTSPSTQVAILMKYSALNFFAADKETAGIAGVATDNSDKPVEYFNLQGVNVKGQPTPGLYIRRQGTEATKVIIR